MTTRIQLSLFPGEGDGLDPSAGFFVQEKILINPPQKVATYAQRKRDARRAWYLQTVFKKNSPDGPSVA